MAAGSIVVDLLMKTGSFETDTEKARKTLEKKMTEMKKSAVEAGKVIGQAIGAFATGVTAMVTMTARANEEMRRFAELSGTSVQGFQTLAAGAKMAGIEQDKLADIFKDTQDKVGDFMQTGGGALKDFFEQIAPRVGVTADQFRKLSGPDALQLYVSSLEKANLSQSDMIFYMEAIASDASLLLPLLKDGGKGFEEFAQMARDFGAVLSDEAIVAMQDFKRSQDIMELAAKGFANQLTTALIPAFQNVVNQFVNTENGARTLKAAVDVTAGAFKALMSVGAFVAGIFKTIGEALGGLAAVVVEFFAGRFSSAFSIAKDVTVDFAENVKRSVRAANAAWDEYKPPPGLPPLPTGMRRTGPLSTRIDTKKPEAVKETDAQKAARQLFEQTRTPAEALNIKLAQLNALLAEGAISWDLYSRGVFAAQDAYDEATKSVEKLDTKLKDEGAAVFERTRTPLERLNMEMARLDELLQAGAIDWDTYGRAIFAAADAFGEASQEIKETNKLAEELGMTFTSAFEDAVVAGKSLSEVLKGLAQDILRIATRKLVTEPLGQVFTNAIGSFFGGGKATGGDVIGGRSYLVGENGPEMFTPRTTGTITPSSGGGAGGATIVQNINVSTGVAQTVRAEIISLMPQIAGAAKSAVADARLRGGSYAAALR